MVADGDGEEALEGSFIEELRLVLDGFEIGVEPLDALEFEGRDQVACFCGVYSQFSAVRTLTANSSFLKGFWRKFTPLSKTPWWAMRSAV